jgi:hypothetical protein
VSITDGAPSHVPRTGAVGADDPVVVGPDRDRLGVAEPVGRRMAAGAGVVVVQARDRVEPQQPADVREPRLDRSAKPPGQARFDPTGKREVAQTDREPAIERVVPASEQRLGRQERDREQ